MGGNTETAERPDRARHWACRVLQIAFGAMCVAVAWRALMYGDAVFSVLFMNADLDESTVLAVESVAGWGMAVAAFAIQFRRAWPVAVGVGLWMAVIATCTMVAGHRHALLVPASHAVRWLGPLALAALLSGRIAERRPVFALRLAAGATFAGHGLEAYAREATFYDYLFVAGRIVGWDISTTAATRLLDVIGTVDLVVAVALVAGSPSRLRGVALYMAFWGFATATMRTVHSGFELAYETLLRFPNGGVPLALWGYWRIRSRSSSSRAG